MKTMRTGKSDGACGGALIYALIATATVAVMATCLLQLSKATIGRAQSSLEIKRAFYLAEAGLAEAYGGLMIGKTGNVGTREAPAGFGQGLFWVEATPLDDSRVQLESTGMCALGSAVLSMVAERGEQSVASLGLFAQRPLAIPAGVYVSGYDSASGVPPVEVPLLPPMPPAVAPTPLLARIGSNDNIAIAGTRLQPTKIYADLGAGPAHTTTIERDVVHVGKNEARLSAAGLPEIEAPFQPFQKGIDQLDTGVLIIPAGDAGPAFLTVGGGAQVVVQGPCILVLNDLSVNANGELQFDTLLGPVAVWVLNDVTFASGSVVSTTGSDPSQMFLQAPAQSALDLRSTGDFRGVIYAPEGEVTVGPKFRVYGAVVADQLVLLSGAKLYFDQHLDAVSSELALPKLLSWRIIEMSSASNAGTANDPFSLLGVDRESLLAPAKSHEDQPIHVVYVNPLGNTVTFDGMESGFDWSGVKTVTELTRNGEPVVDVTRDPDLSIVAAPTTAVMDALNGSPLMSTKQLKLMLINTSPLSSAEIVRAIDYLPAFVSTDMKDVLLASAPLGSAELLAMLDRTKAMSGSDQAAVLLKSSPLPADVLARVISGGTTLSASDVKNVTLAQ